MLVPWKNMCYNITQIAKPNAETTQNNLPEQLNNWEVAELLFDNFSSKIDFFKT